MPLACFCVALSVFVVLSSDDLVADVVPHRFGRYSFTSGATEFPPLPEPGAFQSFEPFNCLHVVNQLVFVGGEFAMQMPSGGVAANVLAFDHVLSKWHAVGALNATWGPLSRVRVSQCTCVTLKPTVVCGGFSKF